MVGELARRASFSLTAAATNTGAVILCLCVGVCASLSLSLALCAMHTRAPHTSSHTLDAAAVFNGTHAYTTCATYPWVTPQMSSLFIYPLPDARSWR